MAAYIHATLQASYLAALTFGLLLRDIIQQDGTVKLLIQPSFCTLCLSARNTVFSSKACTGFPKEELQQKYNLVTVKSHERNYHVLVPLISEMEFLLRNGRNGDFILRNGATQNIIFKLAIAFFFFFFFFFFFC